jgi:hypothetical protein
MLEYEWRELEALCERLSDLRHRQSFAQRSKNSGLVEGLKEDIARISRQREQLVQHISARLGAVSAERSTGARSTQSTPAADAAAGAGGGNSDEIVGFLS